VNILAIDTASSVFSLALGTDAGRWYFEADAGPRHSEILMDGIDVLMNMAGLKPGDLHRAACLKGPGSFTGLRIGFAAAKGLALSLGIPLAAVPTLDCMARPFSCWPGLVLPLLDAKKSRFFTALYREGRRLSDYLDAAPGDILTAAAAAAAAAEAGEGRILLTGPDAGLFQREIAENPALCGPSPALLPENISLNPDFRSGCAGDLLEIAKNSVIFDNYSGTVFSGPEYLRKSDAELLFHSDKLEHDDRYRQGH
jgi:tRNA threonylcarbamoyladenosine biosynthesis protein TsaB